VVKYHLDISRGVAIKTYHQISSKERDLIYQAHGLGKSMREIAKVLNRNVSTISRELWRNKKTFIGYLPDYAQITTKQRKRRNINKILTNGNLQTIIKQGLSKHWSPEQIAGRLKLDTSEHYACSETIYRYIYKYDKELCLMLPRRRLRRIHKLDRMPHPADIGNEQISIRHRPKEVYKRKEYGHWEGDTIFFTHRTKQNLTVLVERKSRLTVGIRNNCKDWSEVMGGIVNKLKTLPIKARQTLTLDRGVEFYSPRYVRMSLGTSVYYCDASKPWQKGSVENTNGRLRRFYDREYKIEKISDEEIEKTIKLMNNTPRKCLEYRTPSEVWEEFLTNRCT
jgi:IS30 family transposase